MTHAETRVPAPEWAADLFVSQLAPLETRTGRGAVVWSIAGDNSTARISDQFKADAGGYHARYSASGHFQSLFTQALNATGLKVADRPRILDLGSGSGVNSIVPCLNLFPGARQVATDLSAELLAILADYAREAGFEDDVLCVTMDAMSDHVAPGQFDLVTGASILHHLVQPHLGLSVAARALKPGGHAIFLEPFDGYGLIRLAYQRILAEAELRRSSLAPEVERTLRAMVADIAARTMPDPSAPGFTDLDDKWLFSREQIEAAARACGFTQVRFVPHNDHGTLYRDVVGIQVRLATGQDGPPLPDWALAILDDFDRALPPPVKRLLMLEGTVVLTKGG
jgi:SAM-dependent methyltransferase